MDKLTSTPASPKEIIKATKILVVALVVSVVFFAIIIVFLFKVLNAPVKFKDETLTRSLFLFSGLIAIICLAAAFFFYKRKMTVVKNSSLFLKDKLNQYRETLVKFMALCEGAAMFSVVSFFLTGFYETFLITAVLLLAMVSKIPIAKKLADELNLNWNEHNELT